MNRLRGAHSGCHIVLHSATNAGDSEAAGAAADAAALPAAGDLETITHTNKTPARPLLARPLCDPLTYLQR